MWQQRPVVVPVLETTEASEIGHTGIRTDFFPKKGGGINSLTEVFLLQYMQHRQQTGGTGSHCAAGKL